MCFKRTAIAALACLDGNDFSVLITAQLTRTSIVDDLSIYLGIIATLSTSAVV